MNRGLLSRPFSEIIALICKDLGLDPDWPSLAEEAWALEEIATGAPGQPLAEVMAARGPLSACPRADPRSDPGSAADSTLFRPNAASP